MKKLTGYGNTYYPERWEHKGTEICKLTDRTYLVFDDKGEKVIGRFQNLEQAKDWIERRPK